MRDYKNLESAFLDLGSLVDYDSEHSSVGKSIYAELRNLSLKIENPDVWLPETEQKLTTEFIDREWLFRLGESKEAPVHPITKKQRYEYADIGKRLQKALRVLRWGRAPASAIVLVLNPEGGSRERGHLPCTIGYNLTLRNGKLETTMIMRSNIFPGMFLSDVNLGIKLHKYSAEKLKVEVGPLLYHSMRTYKKLK